MTNSDCWVQFWESDDYKKGTRRFDKAIDVPNMSEYELVNPDGRDRELDDNVDSLKTGATGWLELYIKKNYDGNVLRVPPNSSYPNLDDYNMGGNTNSFRLFSHRPITWPVSDIDAPGECWVRFYGAPRFSSDYPTRVNGPGTADRFSLWGGTNVPWSLTTGPSTWVRLYSDRDFGGSPISLGPNSLIQNFSAGFAMSTPQSLKVFDTRPNDWIPSTPNGQNVQTLLSLEEQNASESLESLIAGIAGTVPQVGTALEWLVGALWPSPQEPMQVWDSIKLYIDALLSSLIEQAKADYLHSTLNGIYRVLISYNQAEYGTSQKGSLFSSLLTEVRADQPYFVDPDDPSSTLIYMIPMSTILIVLLREQALFYEEIYLEKDKIAEEHKNIVSENITQLTALANSGAKDALVWRIGQIEISNEGGSYYVIDPPANYKSGKYPSLAFAEEQLLQRQSYVGNEYKIQLDALLSPVRLWKYLSVENTKVPTREYHQVQSFLISDNDPSQTPFKDDPSSPVTGVVLRSGSIIDSIQMIYGGQPGPIHGSPSSGKSHHWNFEEGEAIIGVFGGAGGAVDQLIFRTNLGREIGTGGSGGNYFIALAPQGVNASLVRIDGYQSEKTLEAIRFTWAYQRYV
ncbi:jacalin-like lectin [Phyllobacterium myrsinacearum]|uniref:Jacalin-type lectin domain-containing protein n=1 Tax=Phyllobacterium myrsinacearum TaxID=28101 RepID=A0A839ERP6_9HYPH|nr:hypothetical protein [Phyllobacterium myrsinacearum]MBA8880878.1 hypothetical protein [Phyllobacterium myrsinacearum]